MSVNVILQDNVFEAVKNGDHWKISNEDAQFPRLLVLNEKGEVVAEFCRWVGVKKSTD